MQQEVLDWYAADRRDLPWRAPGVSAWAVLVSEVMLQQTPVDRVLPVYEQWLARWPTPAALAAEPAGAAVAAWGRLGYPRRALRLHAAAVACRDVHGGVVPAEPDQLRSLPGVGEYTAAAVAAFAHGRRTLVLDTNVRRVLTRVLAGEAHPPAHLTNDERQQALAVLPADAAVAARWSVGLMELGALVCTARAPRCGGCPLRGECRWEARGRPAGAPARPRPGWAGTDRQARGRLLAAVREAPDGAAEAALAAAWGLEPQRSRALAGLLVDGLVELAADGVYRLPGVRVPITAQSSATVGR